MPDSAIFKTTSANLYRPVVVNEKFLDNEPFFKRWQRPGGVEIILGDYEVIEVERMQAWFSEHRDSAKVERLSNEECMKVPSSLAVELVELMLTCRIGLPTAVCIKLQQ